MQQDDEREANEEQGELHLDVDAQPDRQARQAGDARTAEVLAREHQPDRDGDEGRYLRVEQEDVEQRDQQRRAEHEEDREHPRQRPEQKPAGLVAAERQQGNEDEVLADDRRGDVHPADEHRQ